jgi:radical SAM protein with 4Fe4S-binding SPASM domain
MYNYKNSKILSAPIMINLELTSGCNIKCRHCYNFWREDAANIGDKLSIDKIKQMANMMVKEKVFHVVLSGGEPLLVFEHLEESLKIFRDKGISTSLNSNLISATKEKCERLFQAGLDHVLTSLNSYQAEVNDYMANHPGALKKIIQGIKNAINSGLRVSVNMIISEKNRSDIYETAKLCAELGVQKIFATRLVPSVRVEQPSDTDLKLDIDEAKKGLDDLLKSQNDFGIAIGSLISYPLCLLGDLEKYSDFVGRGCPAQRGNRMVINADGESHACTHEEKSYGNIFDIGIKPAFQKMKSWHDGSYLYEKCHSCEYVNICSSGCRSAAHSYFKSLSAKDPLFCGRSEIIKDFKLDYPEEMIEWVKNQEKFIVPKTIRFREEKDFYTVNIRWANAYSLQTELAKFLMVKQVEGKGFTFKDLPGEDKKNAMLNLAFKEAIIPQDIQMQKQLSSNVKKGCSIDPEDLIRFIN